MIDYEKFQLSLMRLELQFSNYTIEHDELSDLTRDAIAETVIQRFETCYNRFWKVLKSGLREVVGLAETPSSPKPVFRLANENGLFVSPVENWFQYAEARIGTLQYCDGEKARKCLIPMPDFFYDPVGLYKAMTRKSWG